MDGFDFLVVGGGSGGIASARRAAQRGARVGLIESARLGGTCVNVGCVPKKIMWNAAQLAEQLTDAADYGFDIEPRGHDWSKLVTRRNAYIERLNEIYARNLAADGVELIPGRAGFSTNHEVVVGTRRIEAEHVLIATGSTPKLPDLPGVKLGITSDGFFELKSRPGRVLIVGGGYVAVELCGVLAALGSRVTLALRHEHPLRSFDPMLGEALSEALTERGIEIVKNARAAHVERTNMGDVALVLADGRR
ncbi:MAG TPA: FAD-dependent oxidoreductase, partial [Polyangiaceae bacterium]